ncbi:MAG TPA: UDP-N-acetylmuramate--L-alanine ligase [Actinomycetota bacterium]|nr:UDP-N-acetylmuramate--L-alanine ligase [Actinomycetota bacterium]
MNHRSAHIEPSDAHTPSDRISAITGLVLPDISRWRSAHLVGIGGAGMSGIARLLLARGVAVTGSDLKESRTLDGLRSTTEIFVGHRPEQIGNPDAVVVSTAIPPDNPEVQEARRRGIPVVTRAQVLAALTRGHRTVAVAGTHGKTTTTSMITVMLSGVGSDPTFVVGGDLNEIGSGAGVGSGDIFVAEADESDGSFLLLHPDIALITNIEEDHLDFYAGREEIERAFAAFAKQAGTVVAWWDDPGVRSALQGASNVIREGSSPDYDVVISSWEPLPTGARGRVEVLGTTVDVELAVPGEHNVRHAGEALAVAALLGLPLDRAAEALASFTGVRRRFDFRGEAGGVRFVDDYAHHPSEVEVVLQTARMGNPGRIVAVFQPHRYTRTASMWRELGESMAGADVAVITDVYPAGEPPIPGVTGKLLVDALSAVAPGKRVIYLPRRSDVPWLLAREVRRGDLVMTMGAGDITMVGEETLEHLRETKS